MKPYTELAPAYDYLLRHVDYQSWYEYLEKIMLVYCESHDMIIELGCGTGRFGAKFSNDNYTIFGIDRSHEMLKVAKTRSYHGFRVICSDMRSFHLAKKADFIFSVHDTMNYFLNYSDLRKVLRSVKGIMHDKSVFMFDITTEYNINSNFDGKTKMCDVRGTLVEWGNSFDRDKRLVYSELSFLKKNGTKIIEHHVQRIYDESEILRVLMEEKFEVLDIFGDYTFSPPRDNTIMINFITRKKA
jgi:SAM-dependent methyltransferase